MPHELETRCSVTWCHYMLSLGYMPEQDGAWMLDGRPIITAQYRPTVEPVETVNPAQGTLSAMDTEPMPARCGQCEDVDIPECKLQTVQDMDAMYCEDCISDVACYVPSAGEWYPQDDCVYVENSGDYIHQDDAFSCDNCDSVEHTDHSNSAFSAYHRHETICDHCREDGDYAYPQDDESNLYHVDALFWSDRHECYFADEDCGGSGASLHCYSTDVLEAIDHKAMLDDGTTVYNFRKQLIFGVELETGVRDGYDARDVAESLCESTNFQEHGICKEDGSVSGPELVTLPATMLGHINHYDWAAWCEHLRPQCRGHYSNAGIHVHINRSAVSSLTLGKMLVFCNARDNAELLSSIAQRDVLATEWCEMNSGKFDKVGKSAADPQNGKYSILNVTRNTIECRMFKANLKHERIFKNVEFCHALVKFCIATSARQLGARYFTAFIDANKSTYPHLAVFMIDRSLI